MIKELSLYKIRDLAVNSGRSVFSAQQLANLIGKPKKQAFVYASRLVKAGLAVRVMEGKLSFSKDDYIVASQLIEPSYISLRSALLLHDLIQQVPRYVECVTTRNTLKYPFLGITYHKIPASLFYGFSRQNKGDSYVLLAEPEKAIIDGLYLDVISPPEVKELIKNINKNRLQELLSNFKGRGSAKLRKVLLQ